MPVGVRYKKEGDMGERKCSKAGGIHIWPGLGYSAFPAWRTPTSQGVAEDGDGRMYLKLTYSIENSNGG